MTKLKEISLDEFLSRVIATTAECGKELDRDAEYLINLETFTSEDNELKELIENKIPGAQNLILKRFSGNLVTYLHNFSVYNASVNNPDKFKYFVDEEDRTVALTHEQYIDYLKSTKGVKRVKEDKK